MAKLDLRDRQLLRDARKQGHTHVKTLRPAKRVRSAAANRAATLASKRSRTLQEEPRADGSKGICIRPRVLEQVGLSAPSLLPCKRIRTKSTLLPAIPRTRLKVKTTLPHRYAHRIHASICNVQKRMFCQKITVPGRPVKRLRVKTALPCFTAPCMSKPKQSKTRGRI